MVMLKKVFLYVINVVEVDVIWLVCWCEKIKDVFFCCEGVKLIYMFVIVEVIVQVLVVYFQVNVLVDGYNILYKKYINVGIVVL